MSGKKFDNGKPPVSLIPPQSILEISKVLGFGENKYGEYQWRKGIKYSRLYSAAQRHLLAYWDGEDLDEESNLPHLAHCIVNCIFILEMNKKWDDRYKKEETCKK